MVFTSVFEIRSWFKRSKIEEKNMTMNVLLVSCFISAINLLDAYQVALTGSTVQLLCPYKSTPSYNVLWNYFIEDTQVILAENNNINKITLSPEIYYRLSVSGNHAVGEYHLNISGIRKSDEGKYECSVATNSKRITLTVIVGPTAVTIENVTPDNTVPGIEGQDMTIKCIAVGGQPPPDVKLVILGSTYTGKQSAQHTFKPDSSIDGSTITCQAGYEEISYFPFNIKAYMYLKLKPNMIPFDPDTLDTEETKSFDVSCQSSGSRPAASIYWLLGQQNVTLNSTSQSYHDPSTDKYSVTSNLRYRLNRNYNGQKLICRASNVAGSMETSLTVNVKYAPSVTVENTTFSLTQSHRLMHSTLDSNPSVNTCEWQQRSKYGEHIRHFSDNNLVLTLPTVSEGKKYQDTGEYICTAENGIIGINGQVKQTGSGYVISNALPVITTDNKDHTTQYGKFGENTKVYVNVYSIPKYSRISWYIGNTQLVSNKYATNEEPVIAKDVFHGVEVQLDGYRITLTISDLLEADFTNYTIRLYYFNQYIEHDVILESASGPETPSNFTITSSSETSITVQWIPGYDGGHTQTFCIEYRIIGTNAWLLQETKTSNQVDTHNLYTLSGLQDKTTYELRMYAHNVFNQSQNTDTATTTTLQSEAQTFSNAIIGAVAGVVVVLLIVVAIIISILIFKKRKGMKETEKNTRFYENSGFQNVQIGDEYEEVVSKSDTQQKQTSKTYESLGTKDAVDVYDDLDNRKGLPSSKPSVDHYEALCAKDKPNFYEELENRQGQTEKVYVNEAF